MHLSAHTALQPPQLSRLSGGLPFASLCASGWVGNPALTLLERVVTCRGSCRPLQSPSGDRPPHESLLLVRAKYPPVVGSPRPVGCGGHRVTPLETGLRPIQASPCVQDLRMPLRYLLSRFPALRRCSCPLWLSPPGDSIVLEGLCSQPPAPVGLFKQRRNGAPRFPSSASGHATVPQAVSRPEVRPLTLKGQCSPPFCAWRKSRLP